VKTAVIILTVLALAITVIYLYQALRPTVVFHTHAKSGYLGKVSTFSGSVDYLQIKNHKAKYRLPHIWKWNDEVEIAIFTENFKDLFKKEDINFCRLHIFLDENGYFVNHFETKYFWSKLNSQ
jgi:hypothetical protein